MLLRRKLEMERQLTTGSALRWFLRLAALPIFIATVAIWMSVGLTVYAQATDGNIVGAVIDPSQALIPNATITATNKATGVTYNAITSDAGDYRINNVPVGSYDVDAVASGMKPLKTANVTVDLNRTSTVNFNLQVGAISTVVEVTEAAPLLDASNAQLQTTFKSDLMQHLPAAGNFLNDTGVLNLSLLAAGVTQSGGVGLGTGPSVGGQRPTNNSFHIDGVDNNKHDNRGPAVSVSNEAVAEFSVLQNQFSPEFGGASGGIFNTVVKTGTNEIHGSLYEYFGNRRLNATDSRAAVQGLTRPPRFDYNRFGGTVGGPIRKNELFYFAGYEYSPLGRASTPGSPISGPTAAGYDTLATLSAVNKTNLGVLQQYLAPAAVATRTVTVAGTPIPIGSSQAVGPSYQSKQNLVTAIDWIISERDQLRGRYILNRFTGIDTLAQLPAFYINYPDNRQFVSLSEFHTFSSTMLNEFRLAYHRKFNEYSAGDFTFPGLDQFPNISINDLSLQLGPDSSTPQGYIQGSLQLTNNVTKTFSRHTIKAGYQFQDVIATNEFIQRVRGDYAYSTLDLYLRDISPDALGERSVGFSGGLPVGFLFHSAYFSDDFRFRPNLTFNLGMRYEYVTVPVVSRYQSFSAPADVPGVITFREPKAERDNWGPRIGVAWSPGTRGDWSVRAGFGINYDMPYNNLNINTKPGIFFQTQNVSLTNPTPNFLAGGGLPPSTALVITTDPATARAAVSGYMFDQNRPYSINYTLSVQHSLGQDYVVEARYVGTKGVHLYVQDQINRVTVVTPNYGLPTFFTTPSAADLAGLSLTLGDIRNTLAAFTGYTASPSNSLGQYGFPNTITSYNPIGNSEYHGLSLQLDRRYSKGFSYRTAFTWSHALDDQSTTVFSTVLSPRRPQDFRNLRNEWGTSALDRRYRFTFAPFYDFTMNSGNWFVKNIVGNWNIAGTYTYQSPAHATVQSGIDSNLNNDSLDRTVINLGGQANLSTTVTPINSAGATVAAGNAAIVAYVANNANARYVQAGLGAYPNGGRNTLPMSATNNVDLQLKKHFSITESKRFEIAMQASNLFNHPQWTGDLLNDVFPNLNNTTRSFLLTGNSEFGRFDRFFTSNPRTITIAARVLF